MSIEDLHNIIKELTEKINNIYEKITPEKDKKTKEPKKYMVDWYKKNKEEHLKKLKNKTPCTCGILVSYGNRTRHLNTPKHKELLLKPQLIVNTN